VYVFSKHPCPLFAVLSLSPATPMPPITQLLAEAIMANLVEANDADDILLEQKQHDPNSEPGHSSVSDARSPEPTSSSPLPEPEGNYRQLLVLVQQLKAAPSGPNHVDTAYKEYSKIKDQCAALCRTLLQQQLWKGSSRGNTRCDGQRGRDLSLSPPGSPGYMEPVLDVHSSVIGTNLVEVASGSRSRTQVPHKGPKVNERWVSAIREWKTCLEQLTETFKTSLSDTYKIYKPNATPDMVDALFVDKRYRSQAVSQMRKAASTNISSANPDYVGHY
jgi:hypothetical protein